jgi:hypothetical protein
VSDSLDKIAGFTGLSRSDLLEIAAAAKANSVRLAGCKRHRFVGGKATLGAKYDCLECGGRADNGYVYGYIAGYEAAGGVADDIWPGYRDVRSPGA